MVYEVEGHAVRQHPFSLGYASGRRLENLSDECATMLQGIVSEYFRTIQKTSYWTGLDHIDNDFISHSKRRIIDLQPW